MNEDSYRKLADHLDQLPGGFASTDAEVALRLLKRLFTPQEAELATYVTLDKEEARGIAQRAGAPLAEVEPRLAEMAHKGLIFSVHRQEEPPLYQAVPLVVGIYEFQVHNLTTDLLQDLADYGPTKKPQPQTIPQMRTIPVGKSIEPHIEALPYEQVDELVNGHDRFAVAPCICRRKATLLGGGCDAPEESCLLFDDWAAFYVRDGRARPIDRAEVTEFLARADAANLVLQPNNAQELAFLCCCCGCCCGVLKRLQTHPKPSEIVASAFIATSKPELCQRCGGCLTRCQMEALTDDEDHIVLNLDRCIGCGLCVTTCPSGALTLRRKAEKEQSQLPVNMDATWHAIVQAQAEGREAVK